MDWIATQLAFNKPEQWYHIKLSDIEERGGKQLLEWYDGSHVKLIQSIYPEFHWQLWRFDGVGVPRAFWDDKYNVKEYVEWLTDTLSISHLDEWYSVPTENILHMRG